MNKIKIIRRGVAKARNSRRKASLDMLRLTGVKRRHAFLRSYIKTGGPIMVSHVKKRYEKPMIIIHAADFVPSLRCKTIL